MDVFKKSLNFCRMHVVLGYCWWLIIVDVSILVVVVLDVSTFVRLDRGWDKTLKLLKPPEANVESIILLLFLLLLLPTVIAVSLIGRSTLVGRMRSHGRGQYGIAVLHLVATAGLLIHIDLAEQWAETRGYYFVLTEDKKLQSNGFADRSIATVLGEGFPAIKYLSAVFSILVSGLIFPFIRRVIGKDTPDVLLRYHAKTKIVYMSGERKFRSRRQIVSALTVLAPHLRAIDRRCSRLESRFEGLGRGAPESVKLLENLKEECEHLIARIFGETKNCRKIEFYSGTTRALEVVGAQLGQRILLSPFEHPTEREAFRLLEQHRAVKVQELPQVRDPQPDWCEVENRLANDVLRFVTATQDKKKKNVLVISEVWWRTGVRIPLASVFCRINELFDEKGISRQRLKIVIDGAHAVGNLKHCTLEGWDAYVFSPHKWLLTPEPMGVAIVPGSNREPVYDAWGAKIPLSTASVRRLCILWAALDFIVRIDRNVLIAHSSLLKTRFLSRVAGCLEELPPGKSEGTCLFSVRPVAGKEWRESSPEKIEELLGNLRVFAKVMNDRNNVWVRIAIGPHSDISELGRLCVGLKKAVRDK